MKQIHIHKRSRYANCVITSNELAQNASLTFAARGLLLYMLSLPPEWNLTESYLVTQSPKSRDHLRRLLAELEENGYLQRDLGRDSSGRITHSDWTVWDHPQEKPLTEKPSSGKPSTGKPSTEKPAAYKNKTLRKTTPEEKTPPCTPPGGEGLGSHHRIGSAGSAEHQQPEQPQPPLPCQPSTSAAQPAAGSHHDEQVPPRRSQPASEPLSDPSRIASEAPLPTPAGDPPPHPSPRRPRDPLAGRVLPAHAIPADLDHLAQLLAEWWEVKTRGRTLNAFRRACELLRQYEPPAQQAMLRAAVVGGWQGLHEVQPVRSGGNSNGRFMSRQERQQQAVDNVISYLAVADPEFAPRQQQSPVQPGDNAIPINDFSFLNHA